MRQRRNTALYRALKDYAKEYLATLRSIYRGPKGLPRVQVQRPQISRDSISYATEVQLDMFKLFFDRQVEPSKMTTHRAVETAMRADARVARHLGTLVGAPNSGIRVDVDAVLRRLLWQLLNGQTTLSFRAGRFNGIYTAVEDYFYRGTVTLRYLSPLRGFQMDGERLELEPGLRMLRLPAKEREGYVALRRQFGAVPWAPEIATGWEEYGIELIQETPKQYGRQEDIEQALQPQTSAAERIDRVVSALRLFKTGAVSYAGTLITTVGWDPFGGVRTTGPTGRPVILGPRYHLLSRERVAFRRLWRDLSSLPVAKSTRLDQAIRRFDFAYERVRPEDKLIDFAIALEALLLSRDEDQELSYRLALRGAVLLGRNSENQEKVRLLLRKAYNVRSDVVHGKIPPKAVTLGSASIPFQEFVNKVEDVVRDAIRQSLILLKGGKDLISVVEERILTKSS